jgi:ribosomal protein S18 acetylase RimI-like enzyme
MHEIRHILPKDRKQIQEILVTTSMFTREEVDVAMELVDIYLHDKKQQDYDVYVSETDGRVSGYICYGPTPAAEGTFDIYWIAVSSVLQAKGIGSALLQFAEKEIAGKKGRLIVIETSSLEKYAPTQAFYVRNQYILESRIKDFYRIGDDRLTYTKRLNSLRQE